MATQVWWHDSGDGLWTTPGNWWDEQDGPDGAGSALSSFNGDEYFNWNGTGTGSTNDCTLPSFSSVSCYGFGYTNGQTVYIQSSTTIECHGNDSDIGDYTVVLDGGFDISVSGTALVLYDDLGGADTQTLSGQAGAGGFANLQIYSDSESIVLDNFVINPGHTVNVPIDVFSDGCTIEYNTVIAYTNGGQLVNDGSSSTSPEMYVLALTLYDFRGDCFDGCTVYRNGLDAVTLNLHVTQPGSYTLPDWTNIAADTGGGAPGTLVVQINTTEGGYSAPTPGSTYQVDVPATAFNGTSLEQLTLRDILSFSQTNHAIFEFVSNGSDWAFTVEDLILDGGWNSTTSDIEYRYNSAETNKVDLTITGDVNSFSSLQDIGLGIHIANFNTLDPFLSTFILPSMTLLTPPAGVPALYPVNIVFSALDAFLAVNDGLTVQTLTFPGDATFATFTNATELHMNGKLTLNGEVTWGNAALNSSHTLYLATGANAAAVLDADNITTTTKVAPDAGNKLEICNPNAGFAVNFGGPSSTLTHVESVCNDVESQGTDGGGNVGITFNAPAPKRYWRGTTSNNTSDVNNWSDTSGGSTPASSLPDATMVAVFDTNYTNTPTLNAAATWGAIQMEVSGAPLLTLQEHLTIGDVEQSYIRTMASTHGSAQVTLAGSGAGLLSFNNASFTFDCPVNVTADFEINDHTSGGQTITFNADDLTVDAGVTLTNSVPGGTLAINGSDIVSGGAGSKIVFSGGTGAAVGGITAGGSGTMTIDVELEFAGGAGVDFEINAGATATALVIDAPLTGTSLDTLYINNDGGSVAPVRLLWGHAHTIPNTVHVQGTFGYYDSSSMGGGTGGMGGAVDITSGATYIAQFGQTASFEITDDLNFLGTGTKVIAANHIANNPSVEFSGDITGPSVAITRGTSGGAATVTLSGNVTLTAGSTLSHSGSAMSARKMSVTGQIDTATEGALALSDASTGGANSGIDFTGTVGANVTSLVVGGSFTGSQVRLDSAIDVDAFQLNTNGLAVFVSSPTDIGTITNTKGTLVIPTGVTVTAASYVHDSVNSKIDITGTFALSGDYTAAQGTATIAAGATFEADSWSASISHTASGEWFVDSTDASIDAGTLTYSTKVGTQGIIYETATDGGNNTNWGAPPEPLPATPTGIRGQYGYGYGFGFVQNDLAASATLITDPPVNTVAPEVTGTPKPGNTLTCSTGTWDNNPLSYAYEWHDSGGVIGTGNTYDVVVGDYGEDIYCIVTATNAIGDSDPESSNSVTIIGDAPVMVTPPVLSGTAIVGETLTVTPGTYTGTAPVNLTYEWYRQLDMDPPEQIIGETGSTYELDAADDGHVVYATEIATNVVTAIENDTDPSDEVVYPIPVNTVLPALSGTPQEGVELTCSTGTWDNSPSSYTYQWYDVTAAAPIGGETTNAYTPDGSVVGHEILCLVTAHNSGGSSDAEASNSDTVLAAEPPTLDVAPYITGTAEVGELLTGNDGEYLGNAPITVGDYQWYRTDGVTPEAIVGATSADYTVTVDDVGFQLYRDETATNAFGSSGPNSTADTAVVIPAWSLSAVPAARSWSSVVWAEKLGLFIAAASNAGTNAIMTSADGGATWTQRTTADRRINGLCWNGSICVAVCSTGTGQRVLTSPDGITWTLSSTPIDVSWQKVAWNGEVFVAVSATGSATQRMMTSPDGITWTLRGNASISWSGVAWGAELFVAVGTGGEVYTSPDGITWTARTAAAAQQWQHVHYANGLFVAVSNTGTQRCQTSPDGITWTLRTTPTTGTPQWYGVTWGGGLWVGVATSGRFMISLDGLTWEDGGVPVAQQFRGVAWGTDKFVAVSSTGTDRVVVADAPDFVSVDADVVAYEAAVVAAGSTLSNAERQGLDEKVRTIKAASMFSDVRRWNPQIGSARVGLTACLVASVGNAADSLNGYADGDWNRKSGLQGTGAAWIGTGWVIDFAAMPNHWMGAYYNGGAFGATKYLFGVTDGDSSCAVSLVSTSTPNTIGRLAGLIAQATAGGIGMSSGVWAVARASTTSLVLYKDNVSQASDATAVGTITNGAQELVIGARNNTGGTKSNWLGANERVGGYIFADTLNSTKRGVLNRAWKLMNAAIGR